MTNEFRPTSPAADLRSAVVVLAGGASGIGRATALALQSLGAHVIVGDISVPEGEEFVTSISGDDTVNDGQGSLLYCQCDVSKYDDVYALFRHAWDGFNRIDHAIMCSGVLERGQLFDPELNIDTVKEPDLDALGVLNINLIGAMHFARIAVVFLRTVDNKLDDEQKSQASKSLTLLGSVASIRESAGLYTYQTSKHGILGLLRSMRTPLLKRDGIRVNCVCPGMTESAMTTSIIDRFRERGLATQTSKDVSRIIIGILGDKSMSGKAVYVEGAKAWEFEQTVWETMPQWLGEEPARLLKVNAEFVASGALLRK